MKQTITYLRLSAWISFVVTPAEKEAQYFAQLTSHAMLHDARKTASGNLGAVQFAACLDDL